MHIDIALSTDEEKTWAAGLMASSEPWTTLGIKLEECIAACFDMTNQVFIAHEGANVCGMIILQDKGVVGSPYIKSLAIDVRHRSQGIGELLLEFAEGKYRKSSKYLFLCVSSFNTRAQKFYQAHGYTAVGELKDYVVPGYSEILMHKKLR